MTSKEYKEVYKKFMKDDCVYYISEHKLSYNYNIGLKNYLPKKPDFILMPNSITRFEALKVVNHFKEINKKIKIGVVHLKQLKPFLISKKLVRYINSSKKGIIVTDNDYADGLPRIISGKINELTNAKCHIIGLKDKTAGHHSKVDNLPPKSKEIIKFIQANI